MQASSIISDDMTLEEKLDAINKAMAVAQQQASDDARAKGQTFVPLDPASLTICDGCE
jgi:hypothetical protein